MSNDEIHPRSQGCSLLYTNMEEEFWKESQAEPGVRQAMLAFSRGQMLVSLDSCVCLQSLRCFKKLVTSLRAMPLPCFTVKWAVAARRLRTEARRVPCASALAVV